MPDDHTEVRAASAPGARRRLSAIGSCSEVIVIVLTGGASTRMGQHKPALEVGGRPIIERVVEAARPHRILVVGSDVAVPAGVLTILDEKPRGGPVSGLATGLAHVTRVPDTADQRDQRDRPEGTGPRVVVVLAGDLPFVTSALVDRLVSGLDAGSDAGRADIAVAVDADGRRNWLCAAWRREALSARLASLGDPTGRSMRQLADGVMLSEVVHRGEATDVDTPDDLARARSLTLGSAHPSPSDEGWTGRQT